MGNNPSLDFVPSEGKLSTPRAKTKPEEDDPLDSPHRLEEGTPLSKQKSLVFSPKQDSEFDESISINNLKTLIKTKNKKDLEYLITKMNSIEFLFIDVDGASEATN